MNAKLLFTGLLIVTSAWAAGCRSPYHADRGAMFGGLAGAGIGAAVGDASGHAGTGAVVGSALGALTGAAIGQSMDEIDARNQAIIQQHIGRRLAGAVTHNDVIAMSQAGLSDDIIASHIRIHGLAQPPTAQDLITLKQKGVSDGVIGAMQQPPRPAVITRAAPAPIIIEEPGGCYGPPVYLPPYHYRRYRPQHGVGWSVSVRN